MSEFADRVQQAVGDAYRIEQELGGGGMSRVFLAEETRLGRQVVIKVLPPEMAAGVNVERFEREILLAAKLQHPHIVPLLTAGSNDDLLFYVMPYIEGESLRAKLAREGELPVPEAVRILKDVLDALAYAHQRGIVHRDVKPDNVMLAGRHAVVTDFGVAKAVQSSTGESSLTSLGMALGTPAYMAPEQAAADPHVDHRADIYALGAMAYEMLTGRPPFTGPNPQSVLSAHLSRPPDPVTTHRETVSPALGDLVMRCLAKKPADRPQHAEELLPSLDALLTPSGGMTPTGTQPVAVVDYEAKARRAHPLRVGVLFALVAVIVVGAVYGLMLLLGLPNWVFFAALGLMALGLPFMLLTGHQERKRAMARATGMHTLTPTGVRGLFTWRRARWSAAVAFAALAVVVGGFMTLRALGIGPFGTLLSSGKLANRAKILVADFDNQTPDSTLARSLTEAFRIDLSQSPVVREVSAAAVTAALGRMERPESTRVTPAVAREIAEREGIPAIITGTVAPVGAGYVLTAQVLSSGDGTALVTDRETAANEGDLLAALSRLSRSIRRGIGESYRSLRSTQSLAEVTTNSLDALRLYTQGLEAIRALDINGALALFRQATLADTAFAMAYSAIATTLAHLNGRSSAIDSAARRAYALRAHLPPVERYLDEGLYDELILGDQQHAITTFRAALAIDPDNIPALQHLAVGFENLKRWVPAESTYQRVMVETDSANFSDFWDLAGTEFQTGRIDAARRTVDALAKRLPAARAIAAVARSEIAYAQGKWDSALAYDRLVLPTARAFPRVQDAVGDITAPLTVQGRLAAAWAFWRQHEAAAAADGDSDVALSDALTRAEDEAWVLGNPDSAGRMVDAALHRYPLATMAPADRPWPDIVFAEVAAGRTAAAAATLERWTREAPSADKLYIPFARGEVLLAERHPDAARRAFGQFQDAIPCKACMESFIAQAWDEAGHPDSALAHYERYLSTKDFYETGFDGELRPRALRHAGALAEQLGRRQEAIQDYSTFVDLWKHADPDLQPVVKDVKARIARLTAQGG